MSRLASSTAAKGADLWQLLRAIATGDHARASRLLAVSPQLAVDASPVGATRTSSTSRYFEEIGHYVYAGDTALHVAAAAYRTDIAKELLGHGADVSARNRRGAQPVHYAADGQPGSERWAPRAQAAIVACLLRVGADPNAADKGGWRRCTAPCARAALQPAGAPRRRRRCQAENKSGRPRCGSRPKHRPRRHRLASAAKRDRTLLAQLI
jgi:hypothetical protein